MAGNLTNLEIFSTGTHRAATGTVIVTDEDLDSIIDAFDSLQGSNIVKPHLKLGHADAQKWFGQKDGIPSLGWITRVWRQGKKLLADVNDIPDALIDMIKSNRFHNVSAEIFWDAPIKHNGRQFSRVLSAVSILGIEMPAVKDLAGLAEALFQAGPIHQFTGESALTIKLNQGDIKMPETKKGDADSVLLYSQEQYDALVEATVAKAVTEVEAKHVKATESLEAEKKVAIDRADQAEAEITKVKAAAIQQEATTLVDQAIKDGKMLPKQRDFALAALSATDTKVKFGDKGEEKTMPEIFKEFIGAQGKVMDLSEKGDGTVKKTEFSTVAEEVDYKVKEFMATDAKLEYGTSLDKVLAADSDLKTRYAESQM